MARPNVPQNETSKPLAPRVRARQLLAHAVQHLGVGLQAGVADLAVQVDHLLQLGDCPVELPLSAVWVVRNGHVARSWRCGVIDAEWL